MVDKPVGTKVPETGAHAAALRFSEETGFNGPVSSLYGTLCREQPKDGQLPVLKTGEASMGCAFESVPKATADFYDHARQEIAQFSMRPGEWLNRFPIGSGVHVGPTESGDACFVLTDNHVVSETEDNLQVNLGDGKQHDGIVVDVDAKHDLALVAVTSGNDTAKLCKTAKFDSHSNGTDRAVGFPAHTITPYLSEGQNLGPIKRSAYRDGDGDALGYLAGEDPERTVYLSNMHVEGANSGSPSYGDRGVRGLVDAGDNNKLNSSFITPVTQHMVDEMKKRGNSKLRSHQSSNE